MDSNQSYVKQIYTSRMNLIEYLKNMEFECSEFENFSIEEIEVMKKYQQLNFKVTNPTTNESCYILYKIETSLKQNIINNLSYISKIIHII